MSAYLVEIDDTKRGVCSPTVVGPFPDAESAQKFAEMMEMGAAAESGQGGYSAVHVVSDETCELTPERYCETKAEDEPWMFFAASARAVIEGSHDVQELTTVDELSGVIAAQAASLTFSLFDEYCRANMWWIGAAGPSVRRLLCQLAVRDCADAEQIAKVAERFIGPIQCEQCGDATPDFELHHLTYRPADPIAAMDNLFALCGPCHESTHGKAN